MLVPAIPSQASTTALPSINPSNAPDNPTHVSLEKRALAIQAVGKRAWERASFRVPVDLTSESVTHAPK
jgi:hypothetical protein